MKALALLLSLAAPIAPALAQTSSASQPAARFTVEVVGSGPPVILIPGLASPRAVWSGIAPDLAKTHTVHLVELKGFGATSATATGPILPATVEQLARYIADNKLGKPAVIGHSMGGLLGLMLAKAHPASIGKLMVIDALPFIGTLFAPGATVAAIEPQAAAMRDRIAASPPSAVAAPMMSITPVGQQQVAAWSLASDPKTVAQALYEDMVTDLRPDMASIATPITLLYPTSPAVPPERATALYGTAYEPAPNARLVPIPGSYHFIMLDQPTLFAAEVKRFLAD